MSCQTPQFRYRLGAEAEGALAQVVDERQEAEACDLHLVQVGQCAGTRQPPADDWLLEERFEDTRHIGAVINERVPGGLTSTLVAKLAPKIRGVGPTPHRDLSLKPIEGLRVSSIVPAFELRCETDLAPPAWLLHGS